MKKREHQVWVSLAWCTSIARYPMRYGRLSGMFINLLIESKLSPERVTYWMDMFRAIDTHTAPGHNGPQFEKAHNEKQQVSTEGELIMK